MTLSPQRKAFEGEGRFSYCWVVVGACLVTVIVSGTAIYAFGVFFKPLQDEFGWGSALTSSANSIFLLVYAFSLYIMGKLADKYGPRQVLSAGGLLMGAGLALCSQIHSIYHFYIFLALVALGTGAAWSPPLAIVQRWFIRRRGLVLGIVTSGAGLALLIFIPLISHLISAYGWRLTYIYLGGGSCFFLTLMSIIVATAERKEFRPYGWQQIEGSPPISITELEEMQTQVMRQWMPGEAIRTGAFMMLVLTYISSMISINMIGTHFVRFAIDVGIESQTAAKVFGLMGGLTIAGKVGMGSATERLGWNWSLVICCFGAAGVILLLLAGRNLWMISFCAVLYGFFYGGTIAIVPGFAGHLFGTRFLAQIIGIVSGMGIAIGSLGPVIAGFIYDKTGSYKISFILAAATFGCAGVLAKLIRGPRIS